MFAFSRRRVIALVVLSCVLLITLDQRGNSVIGGVRSVLSIVLRPFDTAARAVALPIERAWSGILEYDDVVRENEALRDQVDRMRGADIEARSAILEYQELLRLNQLTSKFIYGTAAAQVIGESASNFQNTVEINIGANRGVKVGMPVIDGAGLIGRITKVFPDRSIVLLITDPQFKVLAQVLSTVQAIEDPLGDPLAPEVTTPSGIPVEDIGNYTTTTTLPSGPVDPSSTTTSTVAGPPTTTTVPGTTTTIAEVVRETGTLEGRGAGRTLILRFVEAASAVSSVRVGAVIDTAGGTNSIAPQGIPIGYITRIVEQTGSRSVTVEVTPSATLQRLNFVAVVLYSPATASLG